MHLGIGEIVTQLGRCIAHSVFQDRFVLQLAFDYFPHMKRSQTSKCIFKAENQSNFAQLRSLNRQFFKLKRNTLILTFASISTHTFYTVFLCNDSCWTIIGWIGTHYCKSFDSWSDHAAGISQFLELTQNFSHLPTYLKAKFGHPLLFKFMKRNLR